MGTHLAIHPPPDSRPRKRRDLTLWLVLLGAPTIWLTHLQVVYSLAIWSHHHNNTRPLHIFPIVSIALCLLAGFLTWRAYRSLRQSATVPQDAAEHERVLLMTHMSAAFAVLFILGIIWQWIAIFMVPPGVD